MAHIYKQEKRSVLPAPGTVEQSDEELSLFRKLAEAAFEGIAIHQDGIWIEANKRFADHLGCELHEVIGVHMRDTVTVESYAKVVDEDKVRRRSAIRVNRGAQRRLHFSGRGLRGERPLPWARRAHRGSPGHHRTQTHRGGSRRLSVQTPIVSL